MLNLLKKISIVVILIGTIGVALNILFGQNTITYLEIYKPTGSNLTFFKYNFWNYIDNIRTSIQDTTRLSLQNNPRTWSNAGTWDGLVNNLAYILNVIVLGLNVLMYPFRIAGYIIKTILAFSGINVINPEQTNGLKWLVELVNFLQVLAIPYV